MTTDTRPVVLIVNHNRTDQCGVYQLGKRAHQILEGSKRYRFVHVRADSMHEFVLQAGPLSPVLCIFNYYPGTMDWAKVLGEVRLPCPVIGIAHEITHQDAHTPQPPFKVWIIFDPSFPDSAIYKRTLPPMPALYEGEARPPSDRLVVGSCGFALPGKGYEYILNAVAQEFGSGAFGVDANLNPLVRLHIPPAHFAAGFPHEDYYALLKGHAATLGIALEITSHFRPDDELLEWLASNHLNCLFYGPNQGRGISSAADFCVASGRPLAITRSEQFRHMLPVFGAYPQVSLRETLVTAAKPDTVRPDKFLPPVQRLQKMWSHERFIASYEGIVDSLLGGGE